MLTRNEYDQQIEQERVNTIEREVRMRNRNAKIAKGHLKESHSSKERLRTSP